MRNNSYDTLKNDLASLQNITSLGEKLLKSQEQNLEKYEGYVVALSKADEAAVLVTRKFYDMKSDYENDRIRATRYMEGLGLIKDFMEKSQGITSKYLHKAEMQNEIKKFF